MLMKKVKYTEYTGQEKIRIAFMIQVASYWACLESIYEACLEDTGIETKCFFVDKSSVEKVQMIGTREFLLENKLPYEIYSEESYRKFNPHAAIYQPPYDVSYRKPDALTIHTKNMGTRIVYVPYGIEIADTEDARAAHFDTFVVKNSWRIYTFSEQMKAEYRKYCANRHAVRVCGLPKLDAFYNKKIELDEKIRKKSKGRRIVLWKMHFPKLIYEADTVLQVTPYLKEYEKMERLLDEYKDLFFIVMPHPMFYSQTINSKLGQKAQQLINNLEKHENVHIDKNADYRNSLYNADAIMIDRSALMVEAAVVKIPILYMFNPDYNEPLTPPVKTLVDTYRQGTNAGDMVQFLDDISTGAFEESIKKQEALESVLPYRDGRSGYRIKEDIVLSIKSEKKEKIKLVLFGVGHVCKYYVDYFSLLDNDMFEIIAFSDNDIKKWGTEIYGIPIIEPLELQNVRYDYIVIATENQHMQIKKKLIYDIHLDDENIMRLDYFCEYYEELRKNCNKKHFTTASKQDPLFTTE